VQEPQRRNARFQQAAGEQEEERVVTARCKPHELPPPIRGIVGHDRFTPDSILEAPVTLKFRQLLDVAPVVRRQIAVSMKSSIPRNRVSKNRQEPVEAAASAGQVVDIQEPTVLQTIAKKEEVPTCLYITAWVNNQPLK
jgi:hypothetical protein